MARPSYKTETDILRSIARDPRCRWWWTRHALKQMMERGISAPDVQAALTIGHIDIVDRKADDVWRVKSQDLDGNPIVIACVIFEFEIAIRIVTAF